MSNTERLKQGGLGKNNFCLVIKKPGLLFNEQFESQGQTIGGGRRSQRVEIGVTVHLENGV